MNVAAPIPLGASYLAINQHEESEYKSKEDLDREESAPVDRLVFMTLTVL